MVNSNTNKKGTLIWGAFFISKINRLQLAVLVGAVGANDFLVKLHDFVRIRGLATATAGADQGRKVIVGDLLRGLLTRINILLGHTKMVGELSRGPLFFDGLFVTNKEVGKFYRRITRLVASCACHSENLQVTDYRRGVRYSKKQSDSVPL